MPAAASRQPRSRRGKTVQSAKQTSDITAFTRTSKAQPVGKDVAAHKAFALEAPRTSTIEIVLQRKRKADNVVGSEKISAAASASKKLRQEEVKAPAPRIAPLKRRKAPISDDKENVVPVKPTALDKFLQPAITVAPSTITKSTQKRRRSSDADTEPAALLERLNIQSPARKRTRVQPSQTREILEQLPQELLDLLSLHTALLKSLTLQYAHNGTNVPVDIRSICPGVAQSWGKRKVTSEDIQRCVGILGWVSSSNPASSSPFILCDYGRGKLCIELTPEASSSTHFDEERLNTAFESNLRSLWSLRRSSNPRDFISTLPQAPMTTRFSAVPLLVKGRNALDTLKSDLAKRQAEKEQARVSALPILNADGTKMSLLDRIKHKELALAQSGVTPPSPAELQRRAALQRAEDVSGVIGMLTMAMAEGRTRISFTMPQLLVKLKDSLRTPVSQEDGAACVRLLAAEVAPEWLRVVTIGGKENVVIQCAMQPSKALVAQRAGALLQ